MMNILLLDIETAPHKCYTWGLFNQNIALNQINEPGYTLCWAAKWLGDEKIMFASWWTHGFNTMIKEVYKLMMEADVVIHYNGAKFDIPVLNQEFLKLKFPPCSPSNHIDLLKVVKRNFRFPSNKMNYVLDFLGIEKKKKHKGMELWTGCMEGKAESWQIMEEYNKTDVLRLEEMYNRLLPWIHNHPNHGLFHDTNRPICPNCGSHYMVKRGFTYTRSLRYQRYRCSKCGSWSRDRNTNLDTDKRKNVLVGVG